MELLSGAHPVDDRNMSMRTRLPVLIHASIFCAMLGSCSVRIPPTNAFDSDRFPTDVVGIKETYLTPMYWIEQTDEPLAELLSPDEIVSLNTEGGCSDSGSG